MEVALSWRKSSHSSGSGDDCVEVAACPGTVHVRDSKNKQGPRLALSPPPGAVRGVHGAGPARLAELTLANPERPAPEHHRRRTLAPVRVPYQT